MLSLCGSSMRVSRTAKTFPHRRLGPGSRQAPVTKALQWAFLLFTAPLRLLLLLTTPSCRRRSVQLALLFAHELPLQAPLSR